MSDRPSIVKIGRPRVPIDLEFVMKCADGGMTIRDVASTIQRNETTLSRHLRESGRIEEYYTRLENSPLNDIANPKRMKIRHCVETHPSCSKKGVTTDVE